METEDGAVGYGSTPTVLLGQQCQSYTKAAIWKILDFYGGKPDGTVAMYPKDRLLHLVDALAREKHLVTSDRFKAIQIPCYKGLLALGIIQESHVTPGIEVPGSTVRHQGVMVQSEQVVSAPRKKNRAQAIKWLGTTRVRSIERLIRKRENRAPLRTALTFIELDTIIALLRVTKQYKPGLQTRKDNVEGLTLAATTAASRAPSPSSSSPAKTPIVSHAQRDTVRLRNTIVIEDFLRSQLEVGQISVTSVHDAAQGLARSIERHVYRKANSGDEYQSLLKSSLRQLMRPGTARALITKAEEKSAATRQSSSHESQVESVFGTEPVTHTTPNSFSRDSHYQPVNRRILVLKTPSTTRAHRSHAEIAHNLQSTPMATCNTLSTPVSSAKAAHVDYESLIEDAPTCIACLEVLTYAITPGRRITNVCDHEPLICIDCLAQSIRSQSESKIWNQVECPTCNARLSYQDVRSFAAEPVFRRYEILATLEAMSSLPDFRWCLALGCESGQIHFEGMAQPIMTCVACRWRSCYVHKMEWHEGRTCREVDAQLAESQRAEREANEAYLAANTKLCPNQECGRPIQKSGGCQHMTCSQCRHQYCWDCLAPWTQIRRRGNDAHAETCRFHSRNLVSHPADVARIQRIQRRRVALTVRPNAEPAATTLQTPAPGCRSGSTQHTTNRHAGTTSRSINKRTGIKWRPRSRVGAELSSSAG